MKPKTYFKRHQLETALKNLEQANRLILYACEELKNEPSMRAKAIQIIEEISFDEMTVSHHPHLKRFLGLVLDRIKTGDWEEGDL